MDNQLNYIGRKIQTLNSDVAQVKNSGNTHSYLVAGLDNEYYLQSYLYNMLGRFVTSQDEALKNHLLSFANLLGQKSVYNKVTLNQSIHFVTLTRSVIIGLLEDELDSGEITTNTVFRVIGLLDPLYQLVSDTLIHYYHDQFLVTEHESSQAANDINITLKEITDFKNALNEATIFSITDKDNFITYANNQLCEISKFSKAELIGQNHHIFNSQFHSKGFFDNLCGTIERGEAWKGEILNHAKDGTKFWVDTTIVPFIDKDGHIYQYFYIQYDITERKIAEETLRKTEQLSMVGKLAAGIAHEIRNPLTSIKGFVQLLTESERGKVFTDIILEEIDRINSIVSEFMVFAKPHTYDLCKCNLTDILLGVIKFLQPEALLKNVMIYSNFPHNDLFILGERHQLKQVFLNIIKNAVEAMPAHGKICVSVTAKFEEISISIQDNGTGMSEDQIQKIGEPFYTTKENGTGLGLMVSYRIIETHNGKITIESELNKGTTFTITFPVST
jgi:PAS domain S-box-containing protein